MTKSKFSNIQFPVFGLLKPVNFEYSLDKIFTTIDQQKLLVDDKSIKNESYLSRLMEIDAQNTYTRIKFDQTIRNMVEFIKSKCKICIDNSGTIYNMEIKEKFPFSERTISKINKNHFWFKGISYPFTFNFENVDEIAKYKSSYYGQFVYINNVWYLLELSYEKTNKEYIWL